MNDYFITYIDEERRKSWQIVTAETKEKAKEYVLPFAIRISKIEQLNSNKEEKNVTLYN